MQQENKKHLMQTSAAIGLIQGQGKALKELGVEHLWLFGSRARGDESMHSDWDILVEYGIEPSLESYMNTKFLLEEILGGNVDVVSRGALKSRFIQEIEKDLVNVA